MSSNAGENFSLYGSVNWASTLNIFVESIELLAKWSKRIEQTLIDETLDATVYTGCQQLNNLRNALPRYQQLSRTAHAVWIFGQETKDGVTLDGLNVVPLQPEDPLTQEWFLVVSHPKYSRALIALETSTQGTTYSERMFKGIVTSDPEQIGRFASLLSARAMRP